MEVYLPISKGPKIWKELHFSKVKRPVKVADIVGDPTLTRICRQKLADCEAWIDAGGVRRGEVGGEVRGEGGRGGGGEGGGGGGSGWWCGTSAGWNVVFDCLPVSKAASRHRICLGTTRSASAARSLPNSDAVSCSADYYHNSQPTSR